MNLRTQSTYNSDLAGTIFGNTAMQYNGVTGQGLGSDGAMHDWYQVTVTISGWVRSDLVYSVSGGALVQNDPTGMNLRAQSTYNSDLAGTVYGSTRLNPTGATGQGLGSDGKMHDWYKVTTETITGWVRSDLVTY